MGRRFGWFYSLLVWLLPAPLWAGDLSPPPVDSSAVKEFNLAEAAEVDLPVDTHVYAPGVKGYKPIQLMLEAPPELKLDAPRYPESKILYLAAINESVPVFEGKFRIFEDVTLSADRKLMASIGAGKTVTVKGTLLYQACDSIKCYVPQKTEVSWSAQVMPLDTERAPQAIQHK